MSAGKYSWGRYPDAPQVPETCHWRGELPGCFSGLSRLHRSTLAFGAGRSYGDSCLAESGHVLCTRQLDRFISADWSTGRLVAEAGVALADILSVAIPNGYFLPVTPGTRFATLGGAIANDVHGKNHHRRGTFGRYVEQFSLLRSDGERLICSPESNPDYYAATIGGLGLTGIIEWAQISLAPIASSRVDVVSQRFDDLDGFFALSDEHDEKHEFTVSWVDCAARGESMGRGIYTAGDFADEGPLAVEHSARFHVPATPPFSLVNRPAVRVFNAFYWRRAPASMQSFSSGYEPFFYPLDAILEWNRIYGRRGFQQYQCLVPAKNARDGVRELLRAVGAARAGSFLAVLKRCGDVRSPGLLSFPAAGVTLALDFPQSRQLSDSLLPRLDAIVREAGGRLYPAKDAHMSAEDFRRGYTAWGELEALRDPAIMSRFWRRVAQ